MEKLLFDKLNMVEPANKAAVTEAEQKLLNQSKPIGSLGILEDISKKMSGITGKVGNLPFKKNIILMCADNGVCEEGVSSCPQEVTVSVTYNFTKGITSVCSLARHAGSDITIVDVGIKEDINSPLVIRAKEKYGTDNIARGPAMSRDNAINAIMAGINVVSDLCDKGYNLFGIGEMGIGNTTTASAVLSCLTGMEPDTTTGRGSGLTDEGLSNKIDVIRKAISVNNPNPEDVIDVISKVGGLDIAGMCGAFIGAAIKRKPVVIDGQISAISALCAYRLNPICRDYMFASHISKEHGAALALEEMGLKAYLDLNMRLGEGTGCPLAFNIIEAAERAIKEIATFEEAKVDKKDYEGLWK